MDTTKNLGEEKIFKLLVTYSIPAIVGMLINAIYNIVDRMFIGNSPALSAVGLAGITITFPITIIIMAVSILFGMGGSILFSIRLGQQKNDEAEKVLAVSALLLVLSAVIMTVFGLLFLEPMLVLFGAEAEVLPYAKDYMRIILIGAIFQNIGLGLNNFIRSAGHPKMAMGTMVIGAVVNIILDPILIYMLNMGMAGAALATIIGQACSAIWVWFFFLGKKGTIKFHFKYVSLNPHYVFQIIAYGTSAFLIQVASSLLNIILNKSLVKYGSLSEAYTSTIAISGMGIVNSLITLFVLPIIGINQGSQPIISYNYGANKMDRVRKTLFLSMISATILINIGYIITRLYPAALIKMFNDDPLLLSFTEIALKRWLFCLPIVGIQIVGANYFQAIGKVKQAIFLSMSRQILFLIPLVLILPTFMGLEGILFATPIADGASVVITALLLFIELRKEKRKELDILKS